MTRRAGLLFGLMAWVALPCAAIAQSPQVAPPQETSPRVAQPGASETPPEQVAPGSDLRPNKNGESLSDKLAKQQGTLQPPRVDPGIQAPLPSNTQGTMPVIPPPGTRNGNQTVVPK